jgi:ubiquinone/menaquinone biosynthesis methyltransferase
MFGRIAPSYDRANRVMSMGIDTLWRKRAIAALGDQVKGPCLDLCAGTLDLTLALLDAGSEHVTALDFSAPMLEVGKTRLPENAPVTVVVGDAQDLPLEPGFTGGLCGFGLRNVPDNRLALEELFRVLVPGGRFAVVEFFTPTTVVAKGFHGVVCNVMVPIVGGLISGDSPAYQYLSDSMMTYMTRAEFEAIATDVGFTVLQGRELLPPIAGLVVLERP